MAVELPVLVKTFVAGADLTGSQWLFVKLSGANTVVVCAAATDKPVGVLQNNPASGGGAVVMMIGISKVQADAALATAGTLIGTSSDGQADAKIPGTDTTEYIAGFTISTAANAGELVTCAINCINISRAA